MAISDKTRKLLWGRSGNQCAYCKSALLMEASPLDSDTVVGDECHIIAQSPGGPRHDALYPADQIDSYTNLVILCRTHHKMIDDRPNEFTAEVVRKLKTRHEEHIRSRLSPTENMPSPSDTSQSQKEAKKENHSRLFRVVSGKDLLAIVIGAYAYDIDHDDLQTREEVELVGAFVQNVHDWGELGDDIQPAQQAQAGFDLTEEIQALENSGFLVFGARVRRQLRIEGKQILWPVAMVRVLRKTNPCIVSMKSSQ
jgi:hypothetical protein